MYKFSTNKLKTNPYRIHSLYRSGRTLTQINKEIKVIKATPKEMDAIKVSFAFIAQAEELRASNKSKQKRRRYKNVSLENLGMEKSFSTIKNRKKL